jgi:hypothetical protein
MLLVKSNFPATDLEEVPLGSRPVSMVGDRTVSMDVIPDEEDDLTMGSSQVNSITSNSANGTVSANSVQQLTQLTASY